MTFKDYFLCENATANVVFDFTVYRRQILKALNATNKWLRDRGEQPSFQNDQEINEYIDDLVRESEQNIKQGVYQDLIEAVNRIPYKGSKITIQCSATHDTVLNSYDIGVLDGESIYINVGQKNNGLLIGKFENGKIDIDDIIERGEEEDEDFFDNDDTETDYYNLIKALQNKNAFVTDKWITLYTARPKKDRQLYQQDRVVLPANIFLVNNLDHAIGLAADLAGSDEPRDVYRVRVPETNLIKTMPGNISYYQLTTDTPVNDIRIVS